MIFTTCVFWVLGGSGTDTDSFHISWNGNQDAEHFAYGTYHELELPSTGLQYTIYATDQLDAHCIDSFITPPFVVLFGSL
jgi:hypothetical protein